jgi:hypothetical protein
LLLPQLKDLSSLLWLGVLLLLLLLQALLWLVLLPLQLVSVGEIEVVVVSVVVSGTVIGSACRAGGSKETDSGGRTSVSEMRREEARQAILSC